MKPGCFIKSVIILTILMAAILYIIQHKSELFFNPAKKIVSGVLMDNWDEEYKFVKNSPEKDELKNSVKSFIENLKLKNIPDENKLDKIVQLVDSAAVDSIITNTELKKISEKINLLRNERSEQNRN